MKHRQGMMNEYDCGCWIYRDSAGAHVIQWCPMHRAAPDLLEVCKLGVNLCVLIRKGNKMEDLKYQAKKYQPLIEKTISKAQG